MFDLGLVVADKNMDFALRGILNRPVSLDIRPITFKIVVHSGHDGGVRTNGPELLDDLQTEATHGIVVLDWEGSGAVDDALSLEETLDNRLQSTWGERAKAIVIEPELDAWIWGSNNAMKQVIECSIPNLRAWLMQRGFTVGPNQKPERPKEAIEELLRALREPRSSSLYQKITAKLSLAKCGDPAFLRLKTALQSWFALKGKADSQ